MLYSLFTHFSDVLGARLFTYISFRAITAGILGLLISIWFGNWFINYMKRHNISEFDCHCCHPSTLSAVG